MEMKNLDKVIKKLKLHVNTYSVVSEDVHTYFKETTKFYAGNLFCDLILQNLNDVSETIAQVYYDPQYEFSIILKSGTRLMTLLRDKDELNIFKSNETLIYSPTVKDTEEKLVEFLEKRKPSHLRIKSY